VGFAEKASPSFGGSTFGTVRFTFTGAGSLALADVGLRAPGDAANRTEVLLPVSKSRATQTPATICFPISLTFRRAVCVIIVVERLRVILHKKECCPLRRESVRSGTAAQLIATAQAKPE
jgi:hypothetical protein